ncbi:MAG: universal stress protein [Syntrophales bacterium]|nr:universal stress protein [Syntrophales bacterium]
MVKTILIPTDGSDYGKTAIEYGIYIAKKLDATLKGIHVIDIRLIQGPVITDISGSIGIPACQEYFPMLEKGLEEHADAILNAFQERCKEMGIVPEIKKSLGIIDEIIIEEGKSTDWILLARRGEHFHLGKGGLLGSTAESVVRNSGKPVMVTPKTFKEIESIALAYDGSPSADNALRIAVFLSAKAAWPLSIVIISEDQKQVAKLTQKIATYVEPFHVDSEVIILKGKEEKALVRFMQEGSIELMVMGAYGHNRLRELLLGSTTSYVIRNSPIPVLLTR